MEKMLKHYGLNSDEVIMEPAGFKFIPFHEKLYQRLDVDVRMLYPRTNTAEMLEAQQSKSSYKTIWGSEIHFNDADGEWAELGVGLPLGYDNLTIEEILAHPWPSPTKDVARGLRRRALEIKDQGDYAIGVYRVFEAGIFGVVHNMLRGMMNFFYDLAEDVEIAETLLDKVLEIQKAYYGVVLDEVGDLVDFVETEDDLGMQDRPLISPKVYRDIIKPRHKELIQFIKSHGQPDIKVFMHSDGAIYDLIPDFIDIGVDILNPLQLGAKGIDLKAIKKNYGEKLAFLGGVDVQQPFKGGPDDVRRVVREAIDCLASGGGYILGPTHNYPPDVPVENIVTMFEYAKEYGRY
jgi:uroporphyrinogen decarboxylase